MIGEGPSPVVGEGGVDRPDRKEAGGAGEFEVKIVCH